MLDDSGDANETIKYIGESYLEGKNPTKDAQLFLNVAISGAMVDSNPYFGGAGSFISQCLKGLKEYKSKIFE